MVCMWLFSMLLNLMCLASESSSDLSILLTSIFLSAPGVLKTYPVMLCKITVLTLSANLLRTPFSHQMKVLTVLL